MLKNSAAPARSADSILTAPMAVRECRRRAHHCPHIFTAQAHSSSGSTVAPHRSSATSTVAQTSADTRRITTRAPSSTPSIATQGPLNSRIPSLQDQLPPGAPNLQGRLKCSVPTTQDRLNSGVAVAQTSALTCALGSPPHLPRAVRAAPRPTCNSTPSHPPPTRPPRRTARRLAATVLALAVAMTVFLAVANPSAAAVRPTWRWPLDGHPTILRRFTPPPEPWLAGHRGVDLAAAPATPVVAAGPGIVRYAGPLAGRGVVTVEHADGLRTTYLPVTASVRRDQRVALGTLLGVIEPSNTHCQRSCLHWGLRRGTRYLDPLLLLGHGHIRLLPYWPTDAPGSKALHPQLPLPSRELLSTAFTDSLPKPATPPSTRLSAPTAAQPPPPPIHMATSRTPSPAPEDHPTALRAPVPALRFLPVSASTSTVSAISICALLGVLLTVALIYRYRRSRADRHDVHKGQHRKQRHKRPPRRRRRPSRTARHGDTYF
ncbi:murein hydrolase activator EnvC family protein [Nonomuraea rhizosphaerae]|uniref:murein hydrolase activator EnvC family protein n=1 Tax=Nonomuraea rhizosphaerae TaxID=2665663 RepID=UPI003558DFBB